MLETDLVAPPVLDVSALRSEIIGIDHLVPLLDGTLRQYVNLDNAASTPTFRYVQSKVTELLGWYSSVHRGSGFKSLLATYAYDRAREIVGEFVGADRQSDTVIFCKNTSEAINLLAYTLEWQPDDVVITTCMEHHSNDLPWRAVAQVVHICVDAVGQVDMDELQTRLREYAGRVKLVAISGASNITGFMPPVHTVAEWAHAAGALIMVDAAQLAPHRAIRMGALNAAEHLDFVVLSGHKLYAPYGSGALIGPRALFAARPPLYRGGGTIDFVSLDEVHWADPPDRNEVGSPNVIGAVAMAASMQVLNSVGMDALAAHEQELTRYALQQLNAIPGLNLYGSSDPERLDDRVGVIAFTVSGMHHGLAAAILSFEGAIGVRHGCFCAHPYVLRLLNVAESDYKRHRDAVLNHDRSELPGLARASFGCYNTLAEVDQLVDMLKRVAAGEYYGEYVLDKSHGSYLPRGYDPTVVARTFQL